MEKLSSIGKLEWLRNKILSRKKEGTVEVHVCMTGCRAYGAAGVLESLKDEVKSQKLSSQVEIRATGCHGFCAKAPVIAIEPMGVHRCSDLETRPAHRPPGLSPAQDLAADILPQPDPLLCQTGAPGAGQLRPYRSHPYRTLHCRRRLPGAGQSIVEAVARTGDR